MVVKALHYAVDNVDPFSQAADKVSKFDFKNAKDIDQRLSDVKGIDEIS